MVLIVAKIMSDEFGMRSKLFMMLRGVIFLYPVTGSSWLFGRGCPLYVGSHRYTLEHGQGVKPGTMDQRVPPTS